MAELNEAPGEMHIDDVVKPCVGIDLHEDPMPGPAQEPDPALKAAAERRMRIAQLRIQAGMGPFELPKDLQGILKEKEILPLSGYHGVIRKSHNSFQAKAFFKGKHICIGSFSTAESAARAYDSCMENLVGRERTMNFESDEVARVAAEMAEAALDGPLHVKICNGCGSAMSSKLRVCRQCRNMNNRQTQYKGVKMKNNSTKWQAFLWHEKKNEYLGTFHTPEEAALAYDIRSRELFGEFAQVNWQTREEAEAAVEQALLTFSGKRGPIQKRKRGSHSAPAKAEAEGEEEEEDALMDGAPLEAIDTEGGAPASVAVKKQKKRRKAENGGAAAGGELPLAPLSEIAASLGAGPGGAEAEEGADEEDGAVILVGPNLNPVLPVKEAGAAAAGALQPGANVAAAKPQPKKRGRPPKAAAAAAAAGEAAGGAAGGEGAAQPKRKRGRPPKSAAAGAPVMQRLGPGDSVASVEPIDAGAPAPTWAPLQWGSGPAAARAPAEEAPAAAALAGPRADLAHDAGVAPQEADEGGAARGVTPSALGGDLGRAQDGGDAGTSHQAPERAQGPGAFDPVLRPLSSLVALAAKAPPAKVAPVAAPPPATVAESLQQGGAAAATGGGSPAAAVGAAKPQPRTGQSPAHQAAPQQPPAIVLPLPRKGQSVLEALLTF